MAREAVTIRRELAQAQPRRLPPRLPRPWETWPLPQRGGQDDKAEELFR